MGLAEKGLAQELLAKDSVTKDTYITSKNPQKKIKINENSVSTNFVYTIRNMNAFITSEMSQTSTLKWSFK